MGDGPFRTSYRAIPHVNSAAIFNIGLLHNTLYIMHAICRFHGFVVPTFVVPTFVVLLFVFTLKSFTIMLKNNNTISVCCSSG